MADTKISGAADIGLLVGTDMVPVARSGSTSIYHATMTEVATFAGANARIATALATGVVKPDGVTVTVDVDGTIHGATPSSVLPTMNGTAAVGTSSLFARSDHVHPSDTSRLAVITKPVVTGSKGGNAALGSLLSALVAWGLITDSTT